MQATHPPYWPPLRFRDRSAAPSATTSRVDVRLFTAVACVRFALTRGAARKGGAKAESTPTDGIAVAQCDSSASTQMGETRTVDAEMERLLCK